MSLFCADLGQQQFANAIMTVSFWRLTPVAARPSRSTSTPGRIRRVADLGDQHRDQWVGPVPGMSCSACGPVGRQGTADQDGKQVNLALQVICALERVRQQTTVGHHEVAVGRDQDDAAYRAPSWSAALLADQCWASPSCCISPTSSSLPQRSTILSFSIRNICMPLRTNTLPVGGTPIRSPR